MERKNTMNGFRSGIWRGGQERRIRYIYGTSWYDNNWFRNSIKSKAARAKLYSSACSSSSSSSAAVGAATLRLHKKTHKGMMGLYVSPISQRKRTAMDDVWHYTHTVQQNDKQIGPIDRLPNLRTTRTRRERKRGRHQQHTQNTLLKFHKEDPLYLYQIFSTTITDTIQLWTGGWYGTSIHPFIHCEIWCQ